MISEILKSLLVLTAMINGNPEVSFCMAENKFYLKVLWYKEEKKYIFKYQFDIVDVLKSGDSLSLEFLVQRINREYAQKQLEERNE